MKLIFVLLILGSFVFMISGSISSISCLIRLFRKNRNKALDPTMFYVTIIAIAVFILSIYAKIQIDTVDRLSEDLSNANSTIASLNAEIKGRDDALINLSNELESALAEIDSLEEELTQLGDQLEVAKTKRADIAEELYDERYTVKKLQSDIDFYEENVVFVFNSNSKTYHKYCDHVVNTGSVSVYSPSDARSKGYHPCTQCYTDGYFIGNLNSHVFHKPTCWTLPDLHNRTYFKYDFEAVASGYRSCGNCNP